MNCGRCFKTQSPMPCRRRRWPGWQSWWQASIATLVRGRSQRPSQQFRVGWNGTVDASIMLKTGMPTATCCRNCRNRSCAFRISRRLHALATRAICGRENCRLALWFEIIVVPEAYAGSVSCVPYPAPGLTFPTVSQFDFWAHRGEDLDVNFKHRLRPGNFK